MRRWPPPLGLSGTDGEEGGRRPSATEPAPEPTPSSAAAAAAAAARRRARRSATATISGVASSVREYAAAGVRGEDVSTATAAAAAGAPGGADKGDGAARRRVGTGVEAPDDAPERREDATDGAGDGAGEGTRTAVEADEAEVVEEAVAATLGVPAGGGRGVGDAGTLTAAGRVTWRGGCVMKVSAVAASFRRPSSAAGSAAAMARSRSSTCGTETRTSPARPRVRVAANETAKPWQQYIFLRGVRACVGGADRAQ